MRASVVVALELLIGLASGFSVCGCGGSDAPARFGDAPRARGDAASARAASGVEGQQDAGTSSPLGGPAARPNGPHDSTTPRSNALPAVPPIPPGAFDGDADAFIKTAAPSLAALTARAAAACPTDRAAFAKTDGDVSPAANTPFDAEPRVLEVDVACDVPEASASVFAVFDFATLRGALTETASTGTSFSPIDASDQASTAWPSLASGDPHAVDVVVRRTATDGHVVDVRVTVALAHYAAPAVLARQVDSDRAHTKSAVAPFNDGVRAAIAHLVAACGGEPPAGSIASPAKGTALETDKRVLEVTATCLFGRGDGAPIVDAAPLRGAKAEGGAGAFVNARDDGGDVLTLTRASRGGPDTLVAAHATKHGRVEVQLLLKPGSLPR